MNNTVRQTGHCDPWPVDDIACFKIGVTEHGNKKNQKRLHCDSVRAERDHDSLGLPSSNSAWGSVSAVGIPLPFKSTSRARDPSAGPITLRSSSISMSRAARAYPMRSLRCKYDVEALPTWSTAFFASS